MAAEPTLAAQTIGRFRVQRELGRGAQGTVYLAEDPHLQRLVAVKTLRLDRYAAQKDEMMHLMLDEARITGKLQHPNIVTLFDAGEAGGLPYLVFEYVDGDPLSQVIAAQGNIPPADAAGLALAMLRGLAYAHEQGVVHRDIKPANIMVMSGWTPRIMDFGIALRTGTGSTSAKGLTGTPRYMAPEYLTGQPYNEGCDVFAAGMVLYEMLTGATAVRGSDPHAIMYAMVHQMFERPSARHAAVDERLERIVMRALEKDPAQRFATAADMAAALDEYRRPSARSAAAVAAQSDAVDADGDEAAAAGGGALDYVLRRMRFKSDFPVLSATIASVNEVVSSENEPVSALADSVLKDVALTNKILRMVNTVTYSSYGGSVGTISRAVSILGFQKVRGAALSLMLFDHLQNKAQAVDLKDLVTASYFAGVLSRELAAQLHLRNAEEVFICAMFHRLGKLLATFYLHEEASDIARLADAENLNEDQAAHEVLGMTYTELGTGIAKKWNMPEQIVQSIPPASDSLVAAARTDRHKLAALAGMSNLLCDAVKQGDSAVRDKMLGQIAAQYGNVVDLDVTALNNLVEKAARVFVDEAHALELKTGSGVLMQKLRAMTGPTVTARPAAGVRNASTGVANAHASSATRPAAANQQQDGAQAETIINAVAPPAASEHDPASLISAKLSPERARCTMLTAGIADITATLAGRYVLNDALRIILETMYRSMGFTRVMLCTLDQGTRSLKARFGFGEDTERIVKKGFHIPLDPAKDVFSVALTKAADICVEDCNAGKLKSHVPGWYRAVVQPAGFILFPVVINKKPLALIYADSSDGRALRFEQNELDLLKTLRDQAILAIRQKSSI